MLTDQRHSIIDGVRRQIHSLNRNLPELDATDEDWQSWFEAHIDLRLKLQDAGELESRNIPRQLEYFRRKIEELRDGLWLRSRQGYWNT